MSLIIQRVFWTQDRAVIYFEFCCNVCGLKEERTAELCVRPHEGKQMMTTPPCPASWREIDGKHYCSRHAVSVKVRVTNEPRQTRLTLEGNHAGTENSKDQ